MRIGPMECLLILLAIVTIVGVKKLPEFGKHAGLAVKDLKEQSSEIRESIQAVNGEMNELKDAIKIEHGFEGENG